LVVLKYLVGLKVEGISKMQMKTDVMMQEKQIYQGEEILTGMIRDTKEAGRGTRDGSGSLPALVGERSTWWWYRSTK